MVETGTGPSTNLLSQALGLASELLTSIFQGIDCPLSEQSFQIIDEQIMDLSGEISQLVEITTLMTKLLPGPKKDLVAAIKESHINLLFILKAINQSREKRDLLALSDLIKYELRDNLTMWKIEFIPLIKRLLIN
jgi:hypothetical protein